MCLRLALGSGVEPNSEPLLLAILDDGSTHEKVDSRPVEYRTTGLSVCWTGHSASTADPAASAVFSGAIDAMLSIKSPAAALNARSTSPWSYPSTLALSVTSASSAVRSTEFSPETWRKVVVYGAALSAVMAAAVDGGVCGAGEGDDDDDDGVLVNVKITAVARMSQKRGL